MDCTSGRKKDVIQNKYYTEIKQIKGLGVILVKESGYYDIFMKAYRNDEERILLNQDLLKLAVFSKI